MNTIIHVSGCVSLAACSTVEAVLHGVIRPAHRPRLQAGLHAGAHQVPYSRVIRVIRVLTRYLIAGPVSRLDGRFRAYLKCPPRQYVQGS